MKAISEPVSYVVPPVARAFALLRYISEGHDCRNVSATSKALGINRTTLMRLLHTLEDERAIEVTGDNGGYRLGSTMVALAAHAMARLNIVELARPELIRLSHGSALSAHLGVLRGRDVIYLARETPNSHLVSNVREGTQLPAHATTMGRILLAHLGEEEVRTLYRDTPLETYTDQTATSVTALLAQIRGDLARGFAWSEARFEAGIGSCACAIFDHTEKAVGAINVTGPVEAFREGSDSADRIQRDILQAARLISEKLGFRSPDAQR